MIHLILHLIIPTAHAAEAATGSGPIALFGLDWKLFLAQLVNFAIILFVLWRWVFTPVANGLTARTKKIEDSLADAQKITEDKQTFASWKQAEMSKVRQEAAAIITQTKQEAENLRTELLNQTRTEQERIIQQTQAKLAQEKDRAVSEIKGEIAGLVVTATQAIIQEKLDPTKDKDLIKRTLTKVQAS